MEWLRKTMNFRCRGCGLNPHPQKILPPPLDCDVAAASMLVITAALLGSEVSLGT